MRQISPNSLAKLATHIGTEPVTIIAIDWGGRTTTAASILRAPLTPGSIRAGGYSSNVRHYADKTYPGIEGRIISFDSFDDVVNVSKSGTSQSVSVTLSDHDGELKKIFNSTDIHKKKAYVYQWFDGIPLEDKFLIFSGVISSPVVWKEGDRTLSFDIVTQIEDQEVGFSPEDGQFPSLPQNMVGTTWPLVFGTVVKLPLAAVDDIPYNNKQGDLASAQTEEGTGIEDPSLDKQIEENEVNKDALQGLALIYFIGYLQASHTARRLGEVDDLAPISSGSGTYSGLAKQFLDAGNKALLDGQRIGAKNNDLNSVKSKQQENQKDQIKVTNGELMPQDKEVTLNLGGAKHIGKFEGNNFNITGRTHPANERFDGMTVGQVGQRTGSPVIDRDNYFWVDGGQPLRFGALPMTEAEKQDREEAQKRLWVRYIVAATIQVSVRAVYAYRTVNDVKALAVVPAQYYMVLQVNFGSLPVTMLYVPQALSSIVTADGKSEGWEDELWATVTSPIGPNTVTIIQWLIETYTTAQIDTTSFNLVRNQIAAFPSHFALMDRPNVFSLISDIAYQARCVVWLKNDKFYIKYLAKRDPSVATISESDVLENSVEVTYTETEDLKTKIVAEYKQNYEIEKNNLIIMKYNIKYYGVQEERYNWFIYTHTQLVQRSVMFWLIRKANTFKRITFTTGIDKLNVETLDTITLNFGENLVANGPIDVVVEEAKFNSNDYTIQFTCWVPVRAGEMTEYNFAYTGDLSIQHVFPTPEDINQGRAGNGGSSTFNDNVELPGPDSGAGGGADNVSKPFTADTGNGQGPQISRRPHAWGDPGYTTDFAQIPPEILNRIDSTNLSSLGKKPDGTTRYQYDHAKAEEQKIIGPGAKTVLAKIAEKTGGKEYTVLAYYKGLNADPTPVKGVKAPDVSESETLPTDMYVAMLIIPYTTDKGGTEVDFVIVPPVWK